MCISLNEDNNVILQKNMKVIGACKFCGEAHYIE